MHSRLVMQSKTVRNIARTYKVCLDMSDQKNRFSTVGKSLCWNPMLDLDCNTTRLSGISESGERDGPPRRARVFTVSGVRPVVCRIAVMRIPSTSPDSEKVGDLPSKSPLVPRQPFCRPVASSENVTVILRLLIVAHRYDAPSVNLIHFILLGRSIYQLLRHYDAPLAYPALKRSELTPAVAIGITGHQPIK